MHLPGGASTFLDQPLAESVLSQTIKQNRSIIQHWLHSRSSDPHTLRFTSQNVIGRGMLRGEATIHPMKVGVRS
jgi:Bacterial CdiA-CT RNAse A domain